MDPTKITGYRTNEDYSETLAWTIREDGTVECAHQAPNCCVGCFEADSRLYRNAQGDVIAKFRACEVVVGRTVRRDYSRTRI